MDADPEVQRLRDEAFRRRTEIRALKERVSTLRVALQAMSEDSSTVETARWRDRAHELEEENAGLRKTMATLTAHLEELLEADNLRQRQPGQSSIG